MTPDAVRTIFGNPDEEYNEYDRMQPYLYAGEVAGAKFDRKYRDILKRTSVLSYNNSATIQQRPDMIFMDGKLCEVHIAKGSLKLEVCGIDLFQRNRVAVITSLARMEETVLFSGADYYFESIGVRITAPKFWKEQGSVGLYSRERLESQFYIAEPYEYSPDEISGKER